MQTTFKHIIATAAIFLAVISAMPAATHIWSGLGINDLFTNPDNWSAGGIPAVGEAGVVLLQFPDLPVGGGDPVDNIPGLAVDGVTFAGGNYTLGGLNGATLTFKRTTGFSILCTASGAIPNVINSTLPLVIASTSRVQTDFLLHLDSKISGIGGLKIEGGDVHLRGTISNSYSFTTTVTGGTLYLEKSNGLASIGGDLVVAGGVVRNQANYQLGLTNIITLTNNGYYIPGAFQESLPAVHFDQGTLQLTTGSGVVLFGDISVTSLGGTITGYLGLNGSVRTVDIANAGVLNCYGTLADSSASASGIEKLGLGSLHLVASNTFTGNLTVDQGDLFVNHSNALGLGNGTTSISAGATMYFLNAAGLTITNETLNLAGKAYVQNDTVWSGPIILSGALSDFDGFSTASGPVTFTHNGAISGVGKLTKRGPSRLVLGGSVADTYAGGTSMLAGELYLGKTVGNAIPGNLEITAGTVELTNSNQIADSATVDLSGGILDLGSRTETIGSLAGLGGEVKFALGTLTTGGAGSSTFSGLLSGYGTNSLIKSGAGTMLLDNTTNGGNTLTGAIIVNQGTLQMDALSVGPITVNTAGTLLGSGTAGSVTVLGGKICLCALTTGNLIINGAGSQALTVFTLGSQGHVKVNGLVNLTGSVLNAAMTYTPYVGSSFVLVENDGTEPITGTFSGLPEGSPVILGTSIFNISYHGGTGNDVVLTLASGGLKPIAITKFTTSPVAGNSTAKNVEMETTGQPFALHVIESSLDLISWSASSVPPKITDAQGHSSYSFLDANATRKFYRIRESEPQP